MTDDEAKAMMRFLLANYSFGSVLHLLAEVVEETALLARQNEDDGRAEQLVYAAHTLFVCGLGLHSILPK